ncbi:MAG: alpha/beta fold hydrolase [Oleispira sp.]|nr:alpha/beta fold hydrolase [Oleispira sp.]MBL4880235.1 alpha/beta fold hydrolase [Oleispira sp.]
MQSAEITSQKTTQTVGPLKGACCVKPGEKIKGTFFLGGAGLNGSYIPQIISSFHDSGINSAIYLDRDKWSGGQGADAVIGVFLGRNYDPRFPMLLRLHNNSHSQFNLIGYSYGSLIAAQLAAKYSRKGTIVDHLVLIGSPISKEFLNQLKNNLLIKNIIIINLDTQGDPIYAGMEATDLIYNSLELAQQMGDSSGHFHYAKEGQEGDKRRTQLAQELYSKGLR